MKLADLIPSRIFERDNDRNDGYYEALAEMEARIQRAESQGYRLVLAMPQHIEPMEGE